MKIERYGKLILVLPLFATLACQEKFTYRLAKDRSDPENPAKQVDTYIGSRGTLFADYGRNGKLDIKCTPAQCEALTPFEDPTMGDQMKRQDVPAKLYGRESSEGRKLQSEFDAIRKPRMPARQETYRKGDITCAVQSEMVNAATNDPKVFKREPGDRDMIYCHTTGLTRKSISSSPTCSAPDGCYEADGWRYPDGEIKLFSWGYFPDKEADPKKEDAAFRRLVGDTIRPEYKVLNDPNENDFRVMADQTMPFEAR